MKREEIERASSVLYPDHSREDSMSMNDEYTGNEIKWIERLAFIDGAEWATNQAVWHVLDADGVTDSLHWDESEAIKEAKFLSERDFERYVVVKDTIL